MEVSKRTAEQAREYGLVNEVVDDDQLQMESWTLARELAAGPTVALGEIKNLMLSTYEQPMEAQLELEARAMVRATRTEDAWNAVNAVLAREQPTFHGR